MQCKDLAGRMPECGMVMNTEVLAEPDQLHGNNVLNGIRLFYSFHLKILYRNVDRQNDQLKPPMV